ncbi:MAG: hypothetical protein P8X94_07640 [Woeseiaceae bacterium]|jgi:hypothetical protein
MNAHFSKSILVLAAAGLLGAASAFGGGPGDGSCDGSGTGTCDGSGAGSSAPMQRHGGPAERLARMANQLGLSLEQQKAALDLFGLQAQERTQLRTEIVDMFGNDICALRDQHRQEFELLLNDEQLAVHAAMLQRRDRAPSEGRGGFGPLECPGDG